MSTRPTSRNTPDFDPCYYEAQKVIECVNDLRKDKMDCQILSENVKHCRQFWKIVQADRRKRGITPHLPPYYERPQAMEEYRDVLAQIQGQKSSGSCVIQ